MTNEKSITISNIDPRAQLPALSEIWAMEAPERGRALAAWVAWFNDHREQVPESVRVRLEKLLSDAEHSAPPVEDAEQIQAGFDEWLDAAGHVGRGESPDVQRN